MRLLIVEDEPYMAEAIRDGLRLEAIAADIAGDGDTASVGDHESAMS
jgi:two-component system response regulator VanR